MMGRDSRFSAAEIEHAARVSASMPPSKKSAGTLHDPDVVAIRLFRDKRYRLPVP